MLREFLTTLTASDTLGSCPRRAFQPSCWCCRHDDLWWTIAKSQVPFWTAYVWALIKTRKSFMSWIHYMHEKTGIKKDYLPRFSQQPKHPRHDQPRLLASRAWAPRLLSCWERSWVRQHFILQPQTLHLGLQSSSCDTAYLCKYENIFKHELYCVQTHEKCVCDFMYTYDMWQISQYVNGIIK